MGRAALRGGCGRLLLVAFVGLAASSAAASCTDGAIEWAGPSLVVGWLGSPPGDPASDLELVLNRGGGARERHLSGGLVDRPDLYPALSTSLQCGFAFWLPADLGPGPHGAEVRVRASAGAPWLHVDAAVIDEAAVAPYGGCQILYGQQEDEASGVTFNVRLWAHDQRLPDLEPLALVIRFRDQEIYRGTVPSFCPVAGVHEQDLPILLPLILRDVHEGGPIVVSCQPDSSEPETVIASWRFEP